MNRENLRKLADFLATAPREVKEGFDMSRHRSDDSWPSDVSLNCGTAGCAIGWAPLVDGLEPKPLEGWWAYECRLFDTEIPEWFWCFGEEWATVDNTPEGAAKRIYYLLDHSVPVDAEEQMSGTAPYLFAEGS